MFPERSEITGIVLAGGRARRMGGIDKGLIEYHGRPLIAYALDALRPVADTLLVNANRHAERYAAFGCPVIADATDAFDGPLAGLLAGMCAARTTYVLTLPVDSPLMTGAVLQRLVTTLGAADADVCVPSDGTRRQPVFLLAHRGLQASLERFLGAGGRKVEDWLAGQRLAIADCSDRIDAFANVNAPGDLAELDRLTVECAEGSTAPTPH